MLEQQQLQTPLSDKSVLVEDENLEEDDLIRACDTCRIKKIKCDKKNPCGNCLLKKVQCTREMPDQRKRKRRNSGSDDDLKAQINRMQNQLDRVTELLVQMQEKQLSSSMNESSSFHSSASSKSHIPEPVSSAVLSFPPVNSNIPKHINDAILIPQSTDKEKVSKVELLSSLVTNVKGQLQYLGKSSFLSMSIEAQLLLKSLHEDPYLKKRGDLEADQPSELWAIESPCARNLFMASLDYIGSIFLPDNWLDSRKFTEVEIYLPPEERGIELMEYYIKYILPFQQVSSFSFAHMIKNDVYRASKDPNYVQKVVCASFMMVRALTWPEYNQQPGDEHMRNRLFQNVWLVLKYPSVFITANFLNIQTLFTASVASYTVMHPGLCWMFITQAARLAQTLGLHRKSAYHFERSLTETEIQERRCVFWMIYMTEKTLALSFGRASSLPSYDCDVERQLHPHEPEYDGSYDNGDIELKRRRIVGLGKCNASLRIIEVYDAIYVRLYSAHGLKQSPSETWKAIRELHADLTKTWAEIQQSIIEPWMYDSIIYFTMISGCEFMYWVCMCMIHRISRGVPDEAEKTGMIKTSEGLQNSSDLALSSARKAILVIQEGLMAQRSRFQSEEIIGWSLLFLPFAPFFELFGSVIRTACEEDLRLMKVISGLLNSLSGMPDPVQRLAKVVEVFTEVAKRVVSLRESSDVDDCQNDNNSLVPVTALINEPSLSYLTPRQTPKQFDIAQEESSINLAALLDGINSGDDSVVARFWNETNVGHDPFDPSVFDWTSFDQTLWSAAQETQQGFTYNLPTL
ncbi:fungal-specific transcription factor domain-containing protein [Lipomyces japonicus]|uniref:fungal-specific transcription factor domain-containing protein n=1 Tax=Lipomyces japonicus TaxID=56871 RepID=UPI0034CE21EF